jgi:hypothetical protein
MILCILVESGSCFGATCCIHLQDKKKVADSFDTALQVQYGRYCSVEDASTIFKEKSVMCHCLCCTRLQLYQSEATIELKLAKEVVTILHEKLNTARSLEHTYSGTQSTHNELTTTTCDKNLEEILTEVSNTATTWKWVTLARSKFSFNKKLMVQRNKPIPMVTNHYAILDNLKCVTVHNSPLNNSTRQKPRALAC